MQIDMKTSPPFPPISLQHCCKGSGGITITAAFPSTSVNINLIKDIKMEDSNLLYQYSESSILVKHHLTMLENVIFKK